MNTRYQTAQIISTATVSTLLMWSAYHHEVRHIPQHAHTVLLYTGCPHHGTVRLAGGETSDTGRLELCYNGEWSPLSTSSGFGYNEAATACRQLGFTEYPSE